MYSLMETPIKGNIPKDDLTDGESIPGIMELLTLGNGKTA